MTLQVLTANRLDDGAVVYLDRSCYWVEQLEAAAILREPQEIEAFETQAKADVAARRIVEPYLIPVLEADGRPVPLSQRERIRALGPSIRPDLGRQASGG